MINLAGSIRYLKEKYIGLLFIGLIFFVVIFSATTLTTKPKLWIDEALTVDLAHNFSELGRLDIQVAPGQFSGLPHLLQSTGYPLTSILALAFNFFGFNLTVERMVMLLFMIICLLVLFLFGKKIFNKEKALLSLLLIASFASFYGSGRTAVGEIPGLIFLIIGLYFWLYDSAYYWTGLFIGLAIVTKPSVFLLAFPAIILALLIEREDFLKKVFKIGLGIAPAIVGWIFLVLDQPFLKATWIEIINFYKDPYGGTTTSNVVNNLINFFHSTTLVYFTFLFLIIILGRYWANDKKIKAFFNFVIFYSLIAFVYYLRSPGWLRYILIAELFILFTLPEALSLIFLRFNGLISRIKITSYKLMTAVVLFFVIIQFINLFTAAQIYASDSAIRTAEFINEKFPQASIGIIDAIEVSAFLKTSKKYQTFQLLGIPKISQNFLLTGSMPEILVFSSSRGSIQDKGAIINNYYDRFADVNGYEIYNKKEQINK